MTLPDIRIPSRKSLAERRGADPAIAAYYTLRRSAGVSVREVAKRSGLSVSIHTSMVRGGETRIVTVRKLLNAIGYDLAIVPRSAP